MVFKLILSLLLGLFFSASCSDSEMSTSGDQKPLPETGTPDAEFPQRSLLALTDPPYSSITTFQENFSTKPDGSLYKAGDTLVSRAGMTYSTNFSTIQTDPAGTGNNYVYGAGKGDALVTFIKPMMGKINLSFRGKFRAGNANTLVTLWNSANEQIDPQALGLYVAGYTPNIRYNTISYVTWGNDWHTFNYEIDTEAAADNIKIKIDGSLKFTATSTTLPNTNLKTIKVSQILIIDDIAVGTTGQQTAEFENFYSKDFEEYQVGSSIATAADELNVRVKGFGPVQQNPNSKNITNYVTGTQSSIASTSVPLGEISFAPIKSKMEISFRMRGADSMIQLDSFGIYSYDAPIFMLKNVNKSIRYISTTNTIIMAPALDNWVDIKITTDPALATNNTEIFLNNVSKGKVTISALDSTPINSIRFGSLMSIDNLNISGAHTEATKSLQNAYAIVNRTYNTLVPKVDALASDTQNDKLKKVALQWTLHQSKQMIDQGLQKFDDFMFYAAQDFLNDINTYYGSTTLTLKNSEPAGLFPTIADDCPYKTNASKTLDIFSVTGYENFTPTTIPITDLKNRDAVLKLAFSFLHPQSATNRGNTAILESLLSLIYYKNVYEYDSFSTYEEQAYLLLNKVYPNLILPAVKAKIENSMRAWATSELKLINTSVTSADYVISSWLNGDINTILSVGYKAIILNDQSLLDAINRALPNVYKTLLADGATNYAGYSTEAATYHKVAIDAMAWYFLFTGNRIAYDFVVNSASYWPASYIGKYSEYYTAPSWKYFWNADYNFSRTVAALSKDSYNYKLAAKEIDLLASLLWKAGVPAEKTLPDNYAFLDRNIIGPRGKFGNFNYAFITRDPSYSVATNSLVSGGTAQGLGSFYGMSVFNNSTGWNIDAIAQEFMSSVKKDTLKYDLATDIKSSLSMAGTLQGLSAKYSLTDRLIPLSGFTNTQEWLASRDRAIGMISITSTANNQVNAVNAIAKFISGRRGQGTKKSLTPLDSNTYQYGLLKMKIIQHNFGRADITYSNGYDADPASPLDEKKATLTFKDPLSVNDEVNKHTYAAGTTYYYLIELIPEGSSFSNVTKLELPNGLLGFAYDDGKKKVIMIHNPTDAPVRVVYSNALGYSQYSIHLGTDGNVDRVKYGNMDNFKTTTTDSENSVSPSTASFVYTIPAGRHVLHVGSNSAEDHVSGFKFYQDVFN